MKEMRGRGSIEVNCNWVPWSLCVMWVQEEAFPLPTKNLVSIKDQ